MANRTAVIQTNKGTIRVELLESDAPKTTENYHPCRRLLRRNHFRNAGLHGQGAISGNRTWRSQRGGRFR